MAKQNVRTFTIAKVKKLGKGKYEVDDHPKGGRFTVKEDQTPLDAAKKALSKLCKMSASGKECKMEFVLRETTQGSGHRLFFYSGARKELPKSQWKTIKFPGTKEPVVYKYTNDVTSVDSKKLGHSNPLSDWKQ